MSSSFAQQIMSNPQDKAAWLKAFRETTAHTAMAPHHVELVDIGDDFATLEMPIGDHARQPFGLLHGGVSLLLAESAASMHACWGVDLSKRVPVGIEVTCSHLSSATDGSVRAHATVTKRGRTLIRHKIDIIHIESDRVLCEVRVTNLYKTL